MTFDFDRDMRRQLAHRLMDRIDKFRELRGGHSMVADVLADDLGSQLRIASVGVHPMGPKKLMPIYSGAFD